MGDHQAKARCNILYGLKEPILETHKLEIGYLQGRSQLLSIAKNLNLQIFPEELICLVGPNGVGKSTLLRTISRLQPALAGQVLIQGQPLQSFSDKQLARQVSVVLTGHVQVGKMRAADLVGLGRFPFTGLFDKLGEQDHQVVSEALAMAGAAELAERYVPELSDGERQRVMIARALAQEPALLMLDEPTAFLDLPGRVSMMHLLRELAQQRGKAVLSSTHDLDLALHSADRIWLMSKDGRIVQGSPEDLVLSGQFGNTFSQPNVKFDSATGNFEHTNPYKGSVVLHAQGLAGIWTDRALRRSGFEVLTEGDTDDPLVEVYGEGQDATWRLTKDDLFREFDSIYALLIAINE
ncbi:MAG: ABC transporter ATP-binding protein [Anaerolineaceae bacterium]